MHETLAWQILIDQFCSQDRFSDQQPCLRSRGGDLLKGLKLGKGLNSLYSGEVSAVEI